MVWRIIYPYVGRVVPPNSMDRCSCIKTLPDLPCAPLHPAVRLCSLLSKCKQSVVLSSLSHRHPYTRHHSCSLHCLWDDLSNALRFRWLTSSRLSHLCFCHPSRDLVTRTNCPKSRNLHFKQLSLAATSYLFHLLPTPRFFHPLSDLSSIQWFSSPLIHPSRPSVLSVLGLEFLVYHKKHLHMSLPFVMALKCVCKFFDTCVSLLGLP